MYVHPNYNPQNFMKTHTPTTSLKWLSLIALALSINYSCNKDNDMLEEAMLDPASSSVKDESLNAGVNLEETYFSDENLPEMGFETRTAIFKPLDQNQSKSADSNGKNTESSTENAGYSLLKYDLSPIDSIGGTLDSAKLVFSVNSGTENNNLSVFKGTSADWSEKDHPLEKKPDQVSLLGELSGTSPSEQLKEVILETTKILPETLNLVVPASEYDTSLTAKDSPDKNGPELVVTYMVSKEAKALDSDKKNAQNTNLTPEASNKENLQAVKATASTGNKAPDSRPSASTVSGSAPLKVQFGKGKSSDDKGIASYKWYFMDGTTSTDPNPSHTFTKPGTYKVILSLHDAEGLENGRIIIINVSSSNTSNKAPDSRPSASKVSGDAPLKVQFGKGKSSDDKGIASYKWYFMDGTTSTAPNPSHTFTKPGTYKVILSIRDQEGLENGRIIVIKVTGSNPGNKAPDARPDASPASGAAPLRVQFGSSKSSDDTGISSYAWDFKDGNKTTGSSPVHTFTKPGTYKVVMTATDKDGLTNSRIVIVTVTGNSSGGNSGGSSGSGGSSSGGGSGNGNNGGSNSNPSNGVKASTFGYNSSDATKALKAAINSSHSTIIVDKQAGDWVVSSLYLNQIRNKTIIFEKGVVLRAKRGAFRPQDRLFQLVNSENVEIQGYGATFAMNKSEYSGQQNHALAIVNSSNITVKGLTLTGAGGDGIYVSRHYDGEYCRNIVVDGVTSTKNQRQGMTVISVDGLQVKNSTFSETSGQSPSAGIDFEPESAQDRLNNITVTNCTFRDNYGPGVMLAVNKLNGSTRPIDITFRNIKVSNNSINNPRLYPTEIDLGTSSKYITNPVKGNITFDGLSVENSRWSAIWTKKTLESYHVKIKNAVIKNVSKGSSLAAIHIGLLGYGNKANANMGGFTFENVLIDYDGVDASLKLFGPGHGNWKLADMRGMIRVESPRGVGLSDNLNRLENSTSSSVNLRVVEN